MEHDDFFTYLPSEIIINILSRLSVRSIATSKCVCKPWLHLLETDDFVNSHLSVSSPALAVMIAVEDSNQCKCKLFELDDGLDLDLELQDDLESEQQFEDEEALDLELEGEIDRDLELNDEDRVDLGLELEDEGEIYLDSEMEDEEEVDLDSEEEEGVDLDNGYEPLTKSDLPQGATIQASVNGLLLLQTLSEEDLCLCNPITREFCELRSVPLGFSHGLGVSKISGEYKLISILPKCGLNPNPIPECHVYTLGTGSWRRIKASPLLYGCCSVGTFVNGNLHWIVLSQSNPKMRRICCFDVETERFSAFPTPRRGRRLDGDLYILRDCLCIFDDDSRDMTAHKVVIWLVKDYEVDKIWTKEFVITLSPGYSVEIFQPIKVFKNGDILLLGDINIFFYYSQESKTTQEIELFGEWDESCCVSSHLLTPSFVSLKRFGLENVISF